MISENYKDSFRFEDTRLNHTEIKQMSNKIGLGIQSNIATFPGSLNVIITSESNQLSVTKMPVNKIRFS